MEVMEIMNGMPDFMNTGAKKSDASDWLAFLNVSITNDYVDRAKGSLEADIQECRALSKLAKDHGLAKSSDTDSVDIITTGEELSDMVQSNLEVLEIFTAKNNQRICKADSDVKTSEFIFGSVYDQFIGGRAMDGFQLFSRIDKAGEIQSWLNSLAAVMSLFGRYVPEVIPNLVTAFLLTKVGLAEAHALFMCKNLSEVFMSEDYWKAAEHRSNELPAEIVVKLLTLYCADATLWMSSPFHVPDTGKGYKSKLFTEKTLNGFKLLRWVIIVLADGYPAILRMLYSKRPEVLQSNLDVLKSTKRCVPISSAQYVHTLVDDGLLPNTEGVEHSAAISGSFDIGFITLAVFAMSEDYIKLLQLLDNMYNNRVSPLDIDLDLLFRCATTFFEAYATDALARRIIQDLAPTKTLVSILNYAVVWAAHMIRINTVWKLRYSSDLKQFLSKRIPALEEHTSNPVLLLKVAAEVWRDREKRIEEGRAKAAAELAEKLREAELQAEKDFEEMKNKIESERKSRLKDEGFQLASDSGRYEKWFKDNTCRIFFKTTSPEEKKSVLVGLEELGISASKVRNIKNPAGIIRTITIGEDEIYSDSLIESALHKAARFKPEGPVFNTEIVSAAFDLVFDKTFFELEWLDKAIVRALDDEISIQDARYCTKVMRDRGIIGQIKGKKNGPKIFALTPEGYSLYQIQKDYPNLPILAVPWEKYIGEEVAERLGTLQYFDINTRPVKDIDKMIAGKTPRFLDKYYVTAI